MEHFCSAVALAFGEAQPGDTYTCGVRIECELHIILGHDSARVGAAWRYNRRAVTASITPHWRRRRLCGDTRSSPPSTQPRRGCRPCKKVVIQCHRRWQTMHNRGWSVSVTCGSRVHQICSASKMSNIIVPLRGTY